MRYLTRHLISFSIITLVSWFGFEGIAQVADTYSFRFEAIPMEQALEQIDEAAPYSIHYRKEWIDSLTVTGSFQEYTINMLLDTMLHSAGIYYLILDSKIILTGKDIVASNLILDSKPAPYQAGYVFEREFAGSSEGEIRTIGNRSLMQPDASALVAGFIKNAETNEAQVGTLVYTEGTEISTITDGRGFYALTLPTGAHTLIVRQSGMKSKKQKIVVFTDGSLSLLLEEEPKLLDEVTIISDQNASVDNLRMGTSSINMDEIKTLPKFLGENDMVQAVLALPGIQNVGEGAAGINVRGGKADQNLLLLNHATIYNPFHYFGFFTSFGSGTIANSEVYKSGIPVSYGGRLSSLVNVTMRKASKEEFAASFALNPITTAVNLEVPLIKGQTSLMLGGRTTYSDWVINRVNNEFIKNSNPSFSDVSMNLNHSYGKGNSINLSGYYSEDSFKLSTDSTINYSNLGASAAWNHFLSDKLSMSVVAGTSRYRYAIDYDAQIQSAFSYSFDIEEWFGKVLFNYLHSDRHELTMGIDAKMYLLSPGTIEPIGESEVRRETLQNEKGLERSIFFSDEFLLSDKISISAGLRYSFFSPIGPGIVNTYAEGRPRSDGSRSSSIVFSSGEIIDTYHGPEVRMSGKYALSSSSSVKLGITQMRQYIHAISNTVSVSPTDTWKLSDPNFAPQSSLQYSLGYYRNIGGKSLEASVETYYKQMENLVDFKIGADLILNQSLETEVVQGQGRAYGIEFLLRKPTGRLNGWVSYTYSRSQQRFDSEFVEDRINGGNYFPSNFEKPHDVSLIGNFKHTRRFSSSINIIFSSGRPVTYPTGKYQLGGVEIPNFSDRNSFRIPNYFRVDISFNLEGSHKIDKPGHGYWAFSIYNVLARRNVYSVYFTNNNGNINGYKLSVLGTAIPSITYNIKF